MNSSPYRFHNAVLALTLALSLAVSVSATRIVTIEVAANNSVGFNSTVAGAYPLAASQPHPRLGSTLLVFPNAVSRVYRAQLNLEVFHNETTARGLSVSCENANASGAFKNFSVMSLQVRSWLNTTAAAGVNYFSFDCGSIFRTTNNSMYRFYANITAGAGSNWLADAWWKFTYEEDEPTGGAGGGQDAATISTFVWNNTARNLTSPFLGIGTTSSMDFIWNATLPGRMVWTINGSGGGGDPASTAAFVWNYSARNTTSQSMPFCFAV